VSKKKKKKKKKRNACYGCVGAKLGGVHYNGEKEGELGYNHFSRLLE
jgi:hypothetical protein